MTTSTSIFQETIEAIEKLPAEEQNMVVDIIRNRLVQQRREQLVQNVANARAEYAAGDVYRGSVEDVMAELNS